MFEGWAAAAAVAGVAGSVIGGAISAGGAESAAQTQANAANNAQQISQQEFNTITQQEQPFMQGGYGALSQLNYLLGIGPNPSATTSAPGAPAGAPASYPSVPTGAPGVDPSSGYMIGPGGTITRALAGGSPAAAGSAPPGSLPGYPGPSSAPTTGSTAGGYGSLLQPFTADTFRQYSPAYSFVKQQGTQGVVNGDTSSQGAMSGSTLKDLISFGTGFADTAFNNAFNQYQTQQGNIYQRLAGIAQLGQAAATNTGQQGTALAGQAAQSATNVGTALGAGTIGAANAISGGIQSAVPWLAYGGAPTNPGATVGGFGYNPSGDAAAIDPATGTSYAAWSDRRLKTDIETIGTLPSGLPLYRFKYVWDLSRERIGVMADEVAKLFPNAVSSLLGYLRVDYGRL